MRLGIRSRQGKRVLVVGLARTGVAVSLFAAGYGATVTATDEKPESALGETAARLRAAGVKLELGGHPPSIFFEQDLIVPSPGVPANLPALVLARARGIPVWSEIELAWRFLRGKLVAITGSNGKTTTTSLVAHILETAGIPTLVGGNIGSAADFAGRERRRIRRSRSPKSAAFSWKRSRRSAPKLACC